MIREDLKKYELPDSPGVYLFKSGRKILYIGKAASLRDRVRSYFAIDLAEARSPAVAGMVGKATALSWKSAGSVLEALILEANLIKRHQPPYNVDEKDNKSWNYVVITKEDFPRVLSVRGRELFGLQANSYKLRAIYGPYPHGGQLKEALKMIRRIFPFRDRCTPCEGQLKKHRERFSVLSSTENGSLGKKCKPCFNRQIGFCPGVCSGEIGKSDYAKTIRNLKQLFSGNFKGLKRQLARDMKVAAKNENFEAASELRRQIGVLEHVRDVSLIKDEQRIAFGGPSSVRGSRIEAYDVAHTSGTETVAVMTVVEDGAPAKNEYRKFKIRSAKNDDVAALKEALSRRLSHPEWPLPRIFVVDGGKGQVRAAKSILEGAGIVIPIVGVVKNQFHKPERLIGDQKVIQAHERDILLANSEAHRYGIGWHRTRLRRAMI